MNIDEALDLWSQNKLLALPFLFFKNDHVKFTKFSGIVYEHLFSFRVFTVWNICWNAVAFDIKKREVMGNRQTGVWLFFVLVKDKVFQRVIWMAHKHIHIHILFFLADWIFPECYVQRFQMQHYQGGAIKIWIKWWMLG